MPELMAVKQVPVEDVGEEAGSVGEPGHTFRRLRRGGGEWIESTSKPSAISIGVEPLPVISHGVFGTGITPDGVKGVFGTASSSGVIGVFGTGGPCGVTSIGTMCTPIHVPQRGFGHLNMEASNKVAMATKARLWTCDLWFEPKWLRRLQ